MRDSQPRLGIIIMDYYSLGSHEVLSIGRQPVVFGFLMFNSSLTLGSRGCPRNSSLHEFDMEQPRSGLMNTPHSVTDDFPDFSASVLMTLTLACSCQTFRGVQLASHCDFSLQPVPRLVPFNYPLKFMPFFWTALCHFDKI